MVSRSCDMICRYPDLGFNPVTRIVTFQVLNRTPQPNGPWCYGCSEPDALAMVTQILVAGIKMAAGNQRPPQLIGRRTTPDLDHGAPIAVEHHGLADQPGVGDAFRSEE